MLAIFLSQTIGVCCCESIKYTPFSEIFIHWSYQLGNKININNIPYFGMTDLEIDKSKLNDGVMVLIS